MGFLVKVKTREEQNEIVIRGCEDGSVEFVREITSVDKDTGEESIILAAYKFYSNIDLALDKLFRMRCCNRDASTLQELLVNVKEERELLRKEFEGILPQSRRRRS